MRYLQVTRVPNQTIYIKILMKVIQHATLHNKPAPFQFAAVESSVSAEHTRSIFKIGEGGNRTGDIPAKSANKAITSSGEETCH